MLVLIYIKQIKWLTNFNRELCCLHSFANTVVKESGEVGKW